MRLARIGILGMLVLAPTLVGCGEDEPSSSPPAPSSLGPTPAACEQEAQRLGFSVLGVEGTPQQEPGGATAYPVLVQWANNGGVHLTCRIGAGGVTIG